MNSPPKKGRDVGIAPLLTELESTRGYNHAKRLQAFLARRFNRIVSTSQLMPSVLALTLAQGTRSYGGQRAR